MGDLYVSPQGDDRWSGRLAEPDTDRTDGPLATVGAAQSRIRARKGQVSTMQSARVSAGFDGPCTVWLRGGTYRLAAPLCFGPEDGGPITYAAYPGETPILDGSRRITGWSVTTVAGHRAWVTVLPEVAEGRWSFRELYVGGARRRRPRYPHQGLHRMESVPGLPSSGGWGDGRDYTRFVAAPGDVRAFENLSDVEIVYVHFWIEERSPLAAYDPATRLVTMSRPSAAPLYGSHGATLADYYLDNVREELHEPGQWYLDRPTGTLTYLPLPGEDPDTTEVAAPVLLQFLAVRGSPDEGRYVEYLRFRGLTFQNTDWRHPDPSDGAHPIRPTGEHARFESRANFRGNRAAADQAACDVPGAIFLEGARHVRFEGCTVRNVGWYAFEIADGSWGVAVSGCTMHDLGAGGVRVNGSTATDPAVRRTGDHAITDCEIRAGGRVFHSAAGVLVMNASNVEVSHNHIHDLYYTGISCGWVWGYMETVCRDNRIEKNHIHQIGQGLLSDMGGIYTLGVQPGTRVRGNHIHDIKMAHYGAWCVYPDEGSSHILIENNVCYDTNDTVFHQHYGRENLVRNNIFAFGTSAVVAHSRAEAAHCSIRFERNVLLTEGSPIFRGGYGCTLADRNHTSDLNVMWDVSGRELSFLDGPGPAGVGLVEWKKLGHDRHSATRDPGFRDPRSGDFSGGDASVLEEIGFVPIDLTDVGPRQKE